ncbi:MAG: ABC transporter ATP-binding protein [Candidatus Sericytochromatia bacterium]|nr:ABC transporter ATP-binding protein [Candidatus Sericytochromatia bacterium]
MNLPSAPASASPTACPPAIAVRGLRKTYGDFTAVDGITFEVQPGDFFAFLGPNGAGKTTTINALVGLARYAEGTIALFGADVQRDFRQARSVVGLAPQEFNFDRYLTVEEILLYQAGYFGVPRSVARERARALLSQFSLWDKRDKDVSKLSGGMKRRLTLARALIHGPRVLILDEPTAGVDLALRLELWDFLRALNAEGMTIFLTTHYLEEAEQLCNRVAIIHQGQLAALDDKRTLLAQLSQDRLELTFATPVALIPAGLDDLHVERLDDGARVVIHQTQPRMLSPILNAFAEEGHELQDVRFARRTLQDIFLELTSRKSS